MMHRAQINALSLVLAVAVVFSDIQPGYLDFDNLPETNFSCDGKVIGGYYADVETGCQMFHVCTIGQKGETSDIKFLCLNGTVFDQETRVCERIDEVECDKSEDFFNLNLELYGNTANFGAQEECTDDECEEDEEEGGEEDGDDTEYDDDTETTTIFTTTTEPTTTTTTTRPTTVRTTQPPTQPRTQGYTRFTTHQPDNIATLLALHNAFNQGFNRRPVLNPVSSTRHPLITSTTTRRPTGGITIRTRFGTPEHQNRPDQGYVLRPRPTFQPTFSSSSQSPLKSNFHTFESGDTHFAHSFDPEKPYHFQYFAQKSSPSPFTVRIEPEVSVVTSTSTSTSIRIANTTIDEAPYEDYDGYDPFFHDVQKITRPKRSTTQRSSSSRLLKTSPDLDLDNFFRKTPAKQKETTDVPDHVIKIDQSDVLISKNYSSDSPERKTEYLDNLLDSIVMEDGEKKKVVELIRNSEPEMEKLISNRGVDLMLEQLENKLLEMELEGRGSGVAFEYEGDSVEIREKRGSDDKSSVGNNQYDKLDDEKSDEIVCTNPEFCVSSPKDEDIQFVIEDRKKRSTKPRGRRLGEDFDTRHGNRRRADPETEEDEDYSPVHNRRRTTEAPTRTTKRSRRKGTRPSQTRTTLETHNIKTHTVTESTRRKNNVDRNKPSTTDRSDIKPVTEEIENDITTAEYRRPPLSVHGERKKHPYFEHTTPYSVPSSTRLQTRFDYENQKTIVTTKRTTQKPTYYRQVPVYEEDDYPEIAQHEKKKSHKVQRRSPIIVHDDVPLIRLPRNDEEEVQFESVPIRRTKARSRNSQVTREESDYTAPSSNRNHNAQISSRTRGVQHDSVTQTRPRTSLRTNRPSPVQSEPRPAVHQTQTSFRSRNVPSLVQSEPKPAVHQSQTSFRSRNVPSLVQSEPKPALHLSQTSFRSRNVPLPIQSEPKPAVHQSQTSFRSRTPSTDATTRETFPGQAHLNVESSSRDVSTSDDNINIQNDRDFDNIKTDLQPLFREDVSDIRFSPDHPVFTPIVDEPVISTQLHKFPVERHSIQNVHAEGTRAEQNHNTQQIGRRRKVQDFSQIRHSPDSINPPTIIQPSINTQDYTVPIEKTTVNVDQRPRSASNQNNHQVGRRRKVIRNRNQFPDPHVIQPEEMTYLTSRPDTSPIRPSPRTDYSQHIPTENERIEVPTTTLPPTTYAPAPGIEADPNFSCRGKVKGGLYADVYADCHGFFICSQAKRGIAATHFWCGVGTRFNQKSRTCQNAAQVDCTEATRLYHLNDNQYNPSIDFEEKLRGGFEPMKV